MNRLRWWQRVYIHPLFILLMLLYAVTGHVGRMTVAFVVVSIHELSHALVAESYGLSVDRIEIWPFGGIARISGLASQDPDVEMMVALAGPLQNFLLAAVAWAVSSGSLMIPGPWLREFITLNLGLGALNLLPIAPLDGGRVASVYLSRRVGRVRAQRMVRDAGLWAARGLVGWVMAMLAFGHLSFDLAIFAVFLYWGAGSRTDQGPYWLIRDLAIRPLRFRIRPVWHLDDLAVRDTTAIGKVLEVMRPMRYHRVLVLDGDLHHLGLLYEEDLISAMERYGPLLSVGELLAPR